MALKKQQAFAIWVTGLPASGKSTLVGCLKAQLAARGIEAAVLESDALRTILTPHARYDDEERTTFYRQMAFIGGLLSEHGVPVIFDATANRRAYREEARRRIPRFIEVFVDSSLEACVARDPKGIYRKAREGSADAVPGLQASYEPPENPDIVIQGDREPPLSAATRIISKLTEMGYLRDPD